MNFENIKSEGEKIIYRPEDTIEVVKELEGALNLNDNDSVKKILLDPQTRESLITNRGKKSENQILLLEAMNNLISSFSDKENLSTIDGKRLIDILHKENIPETFLLDAISSAYHIRDRNLFYKLINEVVLNNRSLLKDDLTIEYAKHHLATWKGVVELNKEEARLINDKIGQETEDSILQTKAKYGRVINSENIKIREKGKIFENEIIPGFSQEKDYADKSRAIQELALINLTKAKNINTSLKPSNLKDRETRDKLIEKTIEMSEEALKIAKEIGYSNAEIVSYRILADAYEFLYSITGNKEDYNLSKKFRKNAKNREEIYGYKS